MNESDLFNKGFDNRKEVLGDAHVERVWANADGFNNAWSRNFAGAPYGVINAAFQNPQHAEYRHAYHHEPAS